jgi:hypothetical protein
MSDNNEPLPRTPVSVFYQGRRRGRYKGPALDTRLRNAQRHERKRYARKRGNK